MEEDYYGGGGYDPYGMLAGAMGGADYGTTTDLSGLYSPFTGGYGGYDYPEYDPYQYDYSGQYDTSEDYGIDVSGLFEPPSWTGLGTPGIASSIGDAARNANSGLTPLPTAPGIAGPYMQTAGSIGSSTAYNNRPLPIREDTSPRLLPGQTTPYEYSQDPNQLPYGHSGYIPPIDEDKIAKGLEQLRQEQIDAFTPPEVPGDGLWEDIRRRQQEFPAIRRQQQAEAAAQKGGRGNWLERAAKMGDKVALRNDPLRGEGGRPPQMRQPQFQGPGQMQRTPVGPPPQRMPPQGRRSPPRKKEAPIKELMAEYKKAQEEAKKANEARAKKAEADLSKSVQNTQARSNAYAGYNPMAEDINLRYDRLAEQTKVQAMQRGLSSTTVLPSLLRGVEEDRQRALRQSASQFAQQQFQMTQQSQAAQNNALAQRSAFVERQTDEYPNMSEYIQLAQLLGRADSDSYDYTG